MDCDICHNPVSDLVLKCEILHLAHRFRILLVGLLDGSRIPVGADHFVETRLGTHGIEDDPLALDDVGHDQAERGAPARRFYELLQPKTTPAPLVALVIGLVLLTAAELVPVLGVMVTLLIMLVGLGAVPLTFVPDWNVPGTASTPPRAVIGGPPMPLG